MSVNQSAAKPREEEIAAPADDEPSGPAPTALKSDDPAIVIDHRPSMEVPYGTLAAWINPATTDGTRTLISQDESDKGDCGRLKLAMDGDHIVLGLASPYERLRHDWVSQSPVFEPGVWTHIALTFDHQGAVLFVNGQAIGDRCWRRIAGTIETPSAMVDFSLEANPFPIVLGYRPDEADGSRIGSQFDDGETDRPDAFTNCVGAFGLWGGFAPDDALDAAQIGVLANLPPAV